MATAIRSLSERSPECRESRVIRHSLRSESANRDTEKWQWPSLILLTYSLLLLQIGLCFSLVTVSLWVKRCSRDETQLYSWGWISFCSTVQRGNSTTLKVWKHSIYKPVGKKYADDPVLQLRLCRMEPVHTEISHNATGLTREHCRSQQWWKVACLLYLTGSAVGIKRCALCLNCTCLTTPEETVQRFKEAKTVPLF